MLQLNVTCAGLQAPPASGDAAASNNASTAAEGDTGGMETGTSVSSVRSTETGAGLGQSYAQCVHGCDCQAPELSD